MLTCSCTMAGTIACKSCSNYIKGFGSPVPVVTYSHVDWNTFIPIVYPVSDRNIQLVLDGYDTERYELVEKKDWKINELKRNIDKKMLDVQTFQGLLISNEKSINQLSKELEDLKKELKELEE